MRCKDLCEECNDMLMEKLNLRNADEMKAALSVISYKVVKRDTAELPCNRRPMRSVPSAAT